MTEEQTTFPFGKNWGEFVKKCLTDERISISKEHILNFLDMPDLRDKYFLDVGCGSGLSSLAALEAGAAKIVSFDVDPDSVRTTEKVREMKGSPAHWTVTRGSILDEHFISLLEPADIVYSWGVLHHTGRMWKAIENTLRLSKEKGLLYIALYTTTPRSGYWLKVKQRYNSVSRARKRLMVLNYFLRHTCIPHLLRGKNPVRFIRGYESTRGMSYLTDVRDWLGGYPYEDAKIEEVLRFFRTRLHCELVNIATGQANTEYLFKKKGNMSIKIGNRAQNLLKNSSPSDGGG